MTVSADGFTRPSAELWVFNGATWDRLRTPAKTIDFSALDVTSGKLVYTPPSGMRFRFMGLSLSCSAAVSLLLEAGSVGGTYVHRTPKLTADTPFNFDLANGRLLNTDQALYITGAGALTGIIYGTEES